MKVKKNNIFGNLYNVREILVIFNFAKANEGHEIALFSYS